MKNEKVIRCKICNNVLVDYQVHCNMGSSDVPNSNKGFGYIDLFCEKCEYVTVINCYGCKGNNDVMVESNVEKEVKNKELKGTDYLRIWGYK